ncbi:dipeptidase 1 [Ictalurus punctatus]|uniref:Dipeptidase n=1 Tax=Ictalurus punctatus TaxID=7998 RepID=A0A2D0RUU1_ICTPU|nr:dipeptidase 1 [Ictalurus punctatus]XP_017334259.1 dipeptidase 1 [Ictalurus punctatus]XP_053539297.1 dipeptidase 1 [Ictalurus punctatus]
MGCIRDVCLVLLACTFTSRADKYKEQALRLMSETPLIDGHNDLPWQLRKQFNNQLNSVDLYTLGSTHTNIPKIKQGHLAAQFWAAYVPCDAQYKDAVRQTLEQIDIIHRMCNKYPEEFMFAASSQDILDAFVQNKTASLIGVEGGHSIDSSMGTLRTMYQLGVRYLTLTHSCNTPWADNWQVDTGVHPVEHNGLSDFGKRLISEMNHIGMLVDLAHVSEKVMNQVLEISKAPIIFSHSSAYSICNHKRNVPDYILEKVKANNGIVMVNFYNDYVTCSPEANLSHVADHFDHIKKVAGSSIVGFGGDYDGVTRLPTGLEDVSKYPDLVAELLRRGWTDDEVKDALGRNLIRVFKAVEMVRDSLNSTAPDDIPIPLEQVQNPCRTDHGYPAQPNAAAMPSHSSLMLLLTLILYSLSAKFV